MCPNAMSGVLIRRENRNKQTDTEGRMPHEDEDSAGYTRQRTPRIPGNHWKLRRSKARFSARAFGESMALLTP